MAFVVLMLLSSAVLTAVHWWGTSPRGQTRDCGMLLQVMASVLAVVAMMQYTYFNYGFGDWNPLSYELFHFSHSYVIACMITLLTTSLCILNVMAGRNPKADRDDEDDVLYGTVAGFLGPGAAYGFEPGYGAAPNYGAKHPCYGAVPAGYGAAPTQPPISAQHAAHGGLPASFGGGPPSFAGPPPAAPMIFAGLPMPTQGQQVESVQTAMVTAQESGPAFGIQPPPAHPPPMPLPGPVASGSAEKVTLRDARYNPEATTVAAVPAKGYGAGSPVKSSSGWEPEKSLPEFRAPM